MVFGSQMIRPGCECHCPLIHLAGLDVLASQENIFRIRSLRLMERQGLHTSVAVIVCMKSFSGSDSFYLVCPFLL